MREIWSDILSRNTEWIQKNTIVELFRFAVGNDPTNLALVTDEESLTYIELEQKSNQVARALSKAGAKPGDVIAMASGRCAQSIIACLAIWKIGCAYVFLEQGTPESRKQECLTECEVKIKVTREFVTKAIEEESEDTFDETGEQDRLAVVVYTSGSSGRPKGVLLTQKNLAAMVSNFNEIGFSSQDRYACFASLMFVASVYDICVTLSIGATLFLIPKEIRKSVSDLAQYYIDQKITVTFLPPHMAMKYIACDKNSPLRILLSGSEAVRNLKKCPYKIINVYASSEGCALISHYQIKDSRSEYPIGKVVNGLKHYIVDEEGKEVSAGEEGELWISGPQISPGYLHRPQQSELHFVKNPFSETDPFEKIYKTGDIVRLDEEGNLIYCGRCDNMVKVRGFRIELIGVEGHMLHYPGIKEVCCTVHKDKGGTNILFGYYISDHTIDHEELRKYLAEHLPYYMVPTGLVQCEEFPRTWTGKVDRKGFVPPPELDDHKKIAILYR